MTTYYKSGDTCDCGCGVLLPWGAGWLACSACNELIAPPDEPEPLTYRENPAGKCIPGKGCGEYRCEDQ